MVLTFHRIVSGCEAGDREAWRAFLTDYTPIVFQLLIVHLALSPAEREAAWREALAELGANDFARLRKFEHQDGREFCIDLCAFVLDRSVPHAGGVDPSRESSGSPAPTPETVVALLKGLPLLDQEILFLKLGGYSDATIEDLLRITPGVAQGGVERLRTGYPALLSREEDRCLWPAAWAEVLRSARASRGESCPSVRQFIRVQEGGFSWYEKEPVERRVGECLHCLERWVALREHWYWRRQTKATTAPQLDAFLSCLPLRDETKPRKSFLGRIF